MKILIVYPYFSTPSGSWSTRIYEFARRWVNEGHHVTVITAPYGKSDIKTSRFFQKMLIEGIHLIVLNFPDNNRQFFWVRALNSVLFAWFASFICLFRAYDVILVSSGPITVGVPLLVGKYVRRKKTVFEVRDLWPSGGVEFGFLKSKILVKMAFYFEYICYKSSNLVVVVSPGQKNHILKRYADLRVEIISNASDNMLFSRYLESSSEGTEDRIRKLIHAGSLGKIHNAFYWIEVAEKIALMGVDNIIFQFIGEGEDLNRMKECVKVKAIPNVYFQAPMPKKDLAKHLSLADATLFATTSHPVQQTSSPNKVYDSFAAGKPVIQTSVGWLSDLVSNELCGLNVDINNVDEAARLIIQYLFDSKTLNEHSKNALKLSQTKFDRDSLSDRYLNLLDCL